MTHAPKPSPQSSHPNLEVITTSAREYVVEKNPNGEIVRGIMKDPVDRPHVWQPLKDPQRIIEGALNVYPDSAVSPPTTTHFEAWWKTPRYH